MGEPLQHLVDARGSVEGLQQLLLLVRLQVHEASDEVGKPWRRGDALHCIGEFRRYLRQQFEDLGGTRAKLNHARLDLLALFLALGNPQDARYEERPALEELEHAKALFALAYEVVAAVGRSDVAHDVRDGADPVQILGTRIFLRTVALEEEPDGALRAYRFLRGDDGTLAADPGRKDHAGEKHEIAHWHDRDRVLAAADAA